MKMNVNIYRLAAVIAFLSLISCTSEVEGDGFGYIDLSLLADVSVGDAVKAPEALPEEDYQDYMIMLYSDDGTLLREVSYDAFAANQDNVQRVPAGTYTVYVESCTAEEAEEGMGKPRLAGSQEFVVTAGRTTTATIACTVINAKITIAYDDDTITADSENMDKTKVLYPAGLSISDSEGRRKLSVKLFASHGEADAVYYNVDDGNTVSLVYTLVAGVYADNSIMRYDVSFTAEKGKWNQVTMTAAAVTGQ